MDISSVLGACALATCVPQQEIDEKQKKKTNERSEKRLLLCVWMPLENFWIVVFISIFFFSLLLCMFRYHIDRRYFECEPPNKVREHGNLYFWLYKWREARKFHADGIDSIIGSGHWCLSRKWLCLIYTASSVIARASECGNTMQSGMHSDQNT